jgi:1-acyl-sn-glycerol-3-phosphate acyltransferase
VTSIARRALALFAWLVTAPRSFWNGVEPLPAPRVYFANHTSNGDFVLIWAALPVALRDRTRPVAAADYWLANPLRSFIGRDVFNAVLIDRRPDHRENDPVTEMALALDAGASLILFPEGSAMRVTRRFCHSRPAFTICPACDPRWIWSRSGSPT